MKYLLQHNLWDYFEALAVGILLSIPPLVFRTVLNNGDTPSILFLAVILMLAVTFKIYLSRSKDVRVNSIPVGFGLLILTWVSYCVFTGVDQDLLVRYGVAAGIIAFFWWVQLLLDEDSVINWAAIGLIVAAVSVHWWGLRTSGGPAPRLPASLLITISSVISIWVVSLLAWGPVSRAVARLVGWVLLASLCVAAPFLWLAERPKQPFIEALIGLIVASLSCIVVFRLRAFVEQTPVSAYARLRIFLTQSKRGEEYFNLQQFQKSIAPLEESVISYQPGLWSYYPSGASGLAANQILLAYAYLETGHRAAAAETALNVTAELCEEIYKVDSYGKRIALTLLLASNKHAELFTEQRSKNLNYLWPGLIDDDEQLRELVQKVIRSAVPLPSGALVDRFKVESHPVIQKQLLQLLNEFEKTEELFQQTETFPGLFSLLESQNPHTHGMANDTIIKADQLASDFLLAGLDREDRSIREYSMQRLIKLGKFHASIEHIKQQIRNLKPQIVLTVFRNRLMPGSLEPGTSLGDLIAGLGNPRGLDVLVNLRDSSISHEDMNDAWKNIHDSLRDQLPDIIWSNSLDVARQAAHLYYQDPFFIPNTLAALKEGTFEARRYAARLAARVMLLLRNELPREKAAMVDLKQELTLDPAHEHASVRVQLTGMSDQTEVLPIPIIYVEPGNPILLLVNNERYRLNIQIRSSLPEVARIKFFALADLVDIPGYAREVSPKARESTTEVEFQLLPNKTAAFEDRLTLTMRINGRGKRLLAHDIFICEPYVLNGLNPV